MNWYYIQSSIFHYKDMIDKKIFILINSDREFDYYNSLIKKYPKHYVVVLNDHKKQVNYHSLTTLKVKKKYLKVYGNGT